MTSPVNGFVKPFDTTTGTNDPVTIKRVIEPDDVPLSVIVIEWGAAASPRIIVVGNRACLDKIDMTVIKIANHVKATCDLGKAVMLRKDPWIMVVTRFIAASTTAIISAIFPAGAGVPVEGITRGLELVGMMLQKGKVPVPVAGNASDVDMTGKAWEDFASKQRDVLVSTWLDGNALQAPRDPMAAQGEHVKRLDQLEARLLDPVDPGGNELPIARARVAKTTLPDPAVVAGNPVVAVLGRLRATGYKVVSGDKDGGATACKLVRPGHSPGGKIMLCLSFQRRVIDARSLCLSGWRVFSGGKEIHSPCFNPKVATVLARHLPETVTCHEGKMNVGRVHDGQVMYPLVIPVIFLSGMLDEGVEPVPFKWHLPAENEPGLFLVSMDAIGKFDEFLLKSCDVCGARILDLEISYMRQVDRVMRSCKRKLGFILVLALALAAFFLPACSMLLPEGITVAMLDRAAWAGMAFSSLPVIAALIRVRDRKRIETIVDARRDAVRFNPFKAVLNEDDVLVAEHLLGKHYPAFLQAFNEDAPLNAVEMDREFEAITRLDGESSA